MWVFVMDKSGAGAGFLRELWFPLPIYIPSASPQSSSLSSEAGTIGEWPQCHKPPQKKDPVAEQIVSLAAFTMLHFISNTVMLINCRHFL
jgi:hypothetical protein